MPTYMKRLGMVLGIISAPLLILLFVPLESNIERVLYGIGFIIGTLVLWMIWIYRRRLIAYERLKRGLCLQCGYDLRMTSEQNCPQCGVARSARL